MGTTKREWLDEDFPQHITYTSVYVGDEHGDLFISDGKSTVRFQMWHKDDEKLQKMINFLLDVSELRRKAMKEL